MGLIGKLFSGFRTDDHHTPDIGALNGDGVTLLMTAVREGDLQELERLLKAGVDVNARGERGWTPLMVAADRGDARVLKALLERGADVDGRDGDGWTPLMVAAWGGGEPGTVDILLEHGADVNARDKDGWTPLMFAADGGTSRALRALLDRGADVDARDGNGWTPLMHALQRDGDGEILRALVAAGATAHFPDSESRMVLLGGRDAETLKLLASAGLDMDERDETGRTLLMVAAAENRAAMVPLIEAGANVDAEDEDGGTLLMRAAKDGDLDLLRLLLDARITRFNSADTD